MNKPSYEELEKRIRELEAAEVARKKIEEALRESERHYRLLAENASDIIWTMDMNLHFTYLSPSVSRLGGYTVDEALKLTLRKILTPQSFKTAVAIFTQEMILEKKKRKDIERSKTMELEFKHKDGSILFGEVKMSFLRNDKGKAIGILGVARDITERKKAEDNLKQNLSLLESTMESTDDGILVIDRKGKVVFFNKRFIELWRIPNRIAMQSNDKKLLDFVLDQLKSPEEFLRKVNYLYSHPKKESFDTIEFKDGRTFERYSRPQVIGNKIVGRVWSFRDITQRKKTEETLNLQRIYFQQLFENSPSGIVILDKMDRIISANKGFEELFLYSMKEIIGENIDELIVSEDYREEARRFSVNMSGKEIFQKETVRMKKNGKPVNVTLTGYPILFDDELMGVYAIYTDISERKQAEKALKENEEKYRHLIQHSNDAIYLLYERNFEIINDRFTEMFGVTLNEANSPGFDFINLVAPKSRSMVEERGKLLRKGEVLHPSRYEFTALDIDGKEIEVEVSVSYIKYKDGYATQGILRDITERKRAENALRFSQFSLGHAADAIFWMGPNAQFIDVNNAACGMLGYSREELLTMTVHDIDPGFPKKAWKSHWSDIKKQGSFTFESVHRRKNGEVFPIDITVNYMKFEGREYNCAFARNITERKQAEQALRESEEKYRSLFENSIEGIGITQGNKIITVNKAVLEVFGYDSVEEFISIPILDHIVPEDRKTLIERFEKRAKGEYADPKFECKMFRKDRQIKDLDIVTTEITIGNEEFVLSTFRDITEKKEAEVALRESEERYRALFNNIADPVVVFDQETHNFVDCNNSAVNRYGYSLEELLQMTPHDLHPQEEIDQVRQNIDDKEDFSSHIYTHITKTGEKFNVEILTQEIEYKGRPAWISLIRDITDRIKAEKERKKLEELLFQSQKMESIGRLAGGIAHDFNNILAAIMGFAEVLKLKYNDQTTSEGKAADVIFRSAKRAGDLTHQLLGFARGGKYNPIPLKIDSLINETITMTEKIFEKNITVKYDFEDDIHTVEVDKNQFELVFTNIAINSRDAMPFGGEILFKTENVFLDDKITSHYPELKEGNYVKISIADTGTGMTEQVKTRIFEPFFTTKGKGKGTGLGLATVYGIIKNHNGNISCESTPGEGTVFTIYLPVSDKEVVKKEATDILFEKGAETILIVDDEEDLRELLKAQLENLGYKVYLAQDGVEGIDIYMKKKDKIDLVLLDMIMPNMDGKETFYNLKKMKDEVKVLIISGYSQDEKATEILQNGGLGFIKKPFDLDELSKFVYEALKK